MERQKYEVRGTDNKTIEFFCCQTNDLNPTRDIRELGIVVFDKDGLQIDFDFDEKEFDSLIDYLDRLRDYCREFNKNSKPIDNQ